MLPPEKARGRGGRLPPALAVEHVAAQAGRRGRPTASQTVLRDARILEVAEQLFLAQGFSQVSISLVARTAGVATRTIYVRFGGKHGLLDALRDRGFNSDSGGFTAVSFAGEPEPRHLLHQLASHALSEALSSCTALLDADAVSSRMGPGPTCLRRLYTGSWHGQLMNVFETGRWRLGDVAVGDATILADLFIGCLVRQHAMQVVADANGQAPAVPVSELAAHAVRRFQAIATER